MGRLFPYLGIVAAFAVAIFVSAFTGGKSVSYSPITITIPRIAIPNTGEGRQKEIITDVQTSVETSSTISETKPAETSQKPASDAKMVASSNANSTETTAAELDVAASSLRSALVNILCTAQKGSGLQSASGSGIIIDPKGIILTNAHVAMHFLLADRGVSCVIRSGDPASARYFAAPIYISPIWLTVNSDILSEREPSGTGEYDFALLAITKSAINTPLPDFFPSIQLATEPPQAGIPVVIASYGAQFLTSGQVLSALSPTIVFGSIKDVFTFRNNTVDIVALGGSVAAQEGSSGGGIAGASGQLVGTITTSTVSGSTDTRALGAITASYIRGQYAQETGEPIDLLLARPLVDSIAIFAQQTASLEAMLTSQLQ